MIEIVINHYRYLPILIFFIGALLAQCLCENFLAKFTCFPIHCSERPIKDIEDGKETTNMKLNAVSCVISATFFFLAPPPKIQQIIIIKSFFGVLYVSIYPA